MYQNRLIEAFLTRRGYTKDMLYDIEDSTHSRLLDVDRMIERLKSIHDKQQHLVILSDFDMDGICCGVEGFAGFSELGFRVSLFRCKPSDGYGFDEKTIDALLTEFPDTDAIITSDVGITCYTGVAEAVSRGLTVLVTDHHFEKNGGRLLADVVVNPNRLCETYEHKNICGAYVLWQVLYEYAKTYGSLFEIEQIYRLRVFAGLGTISDMMPVLYENRELVRNACHVAQLVAENFFIESLQGSVAYVRAFYGLHVVFRHFFDMGKLSTIDDIDEEFFAFYVTPMFNSVKRMSGDMNDVFGIFFGNEPEECVAILYQLNEERKAAVAAHLNALKESYQPYAPYVYLSDADSGILGLLAMQMMSITHRPCFVLRRDGVKYVGSGRAPEWYPALTYLRQNGFYADGHQGAFGIGISDSRELASLVAFISHSVDTVLLNGVDVSEQNVDLYISTFDTDADSNIDIPLFASYIREIKRYAPFGVGFEKPVVSLTFHPNDGEWTVMGSVKQHLKILLPYGFEILCWNQANNLTELQNAEVVQVIGELGVSEFRDKRTVNFVGTAGVMK